MPSTRPPGWFDNPWAVYLLPLVVYLVIGSFEPPSPAQDGAEPAANWLDLGVRYEHYPWIYGVKILLTVGAVLMVARGYPRRRAIHTLAIVVGVVGVVVWVALAHFQRWLVGVLDIEQVTSWLGGHRPGFNSLEQLGQTPEGYLFLVVRFIGLAAVVPVIEEMFLRGFLMRYFKQQDWWNVAIGTPDRWGIVAAVAVPVLMHPQEALAAIVWFGRGCLADTPHQERLGLCRGACRHQPAVGHLCHFQRRMVVDVGIHQGSGFRSHGLSNPNSLPIVSHDSVPRRLVY